MVAEKVLSGEEFKPSRNEFDWLGEGAYFWESNPKRGLEYYRELCKRKGKPSDDGTVVGAVIDMGHCLDLTTSLGIDVIKETYSVLETAFTKLGKPLPQNAGGHDMLLRNLDCAVINLLHSIRGKLTAFDTVRGVFTEGGQIYPGAGILEKTHIQIAVRNLKCIKGVFRVKNPELYD